MDERQEATTFQVVVNNIGVKPAGAIGTLALQESSEVFWQELPITSRQLVEKSYVDDIGLTAKTAEELKLRTKEAGMILHHANMRVKRWTFSGDGQANEVSMGEASAVVPSGDSDVERMLGTIWDPSGDKFQFTVRIDLHPLKNKSRCGPDLTKQELRCSPPKSISRRQYYSVVQSLFDPIGFLSPLLLRDQVTFTDDLGK